MSRILVAYFSASGVTAKLAERLAAATGADLHEIVPAEPYTAADLDWTNGESRSSTEMKNKAFRPAVANRAENMAEYDTVFVGFPIWWYTAPTIVNTFLEGYDWTGKRVIPFATSGSSGMGGAANDLAPSCPGARVAQGKRFAADASEAELKAWAREQTGC